MSKIVPRHLFKKRRPFNFHSTLLSEPKTQFKNLPGGKALATDHRVFKVERDAYLLHLQDHNCVKHSRRFLSLRADSLVWTGSRDRELPRRMGRGKVRAGSLVWVPRTGEARNSVTLFLLFSGCK